jgi:hypothetical protein
VRYGALDEGRQAFILCEKRFGFISDQLLAKVSWFWFANESGGWTNQAPGACGSTGFTTGIMKPASRGTVLTRSCDPSTRTGSGGKVPLPLLTSEVAGEPGSKTARKHTAGTKARLAHPP